MVQPPGNTRLNVLHMRQWYQEQQKTSRGWVLNVLLGVVLISGAMFGLDWVNRQEAALDQSKQTLLQTVVEANPQRVDPAHEGKIVHLTGITATDAELKDLQFGVSVPAAVLTRQVSMYQWAQIRHDAREDRSGGLKTGNRAFTYTYELRWAPGRVSSEGFKSRLGHANPDPAVAGQTWRAGQVTLGAYRLTASQRDVLVATEPVPLDGLKLETLLAGLPAALRGRARVSGSEIWVGDPAKPELGDLRITFERLNPTTEISVLAVQKKDSFAPYHDTQGNQLAYLKYGKMSAREMLTEPNLIEIAVGALARIGILVLLIAGWINLLGFLKPLRGLHFVLGTLAFARFLGGAAAGVYTLAWRQAQLWQNAKPDLARVALGDGGGVAGVLLLAAVMTGPLLQWGLQYGEKQALGKTP
ncbi:MAG: TMEM43 family protein [Deltaproteobacteria bacterium]|nr:TMEM43 family protein [Deltaproteobacteria bacterium]